MTITAEQQKRTDALAVLENKVNAAQGSGGYVNTELSKILNEYEKGTADLNRTTDDIAKKMKELEKAFLDGLKRIRTEIADGTASVVEGDRNVLYQRMFGEETAAPPDETAADKTTREARIATSQKESIQGAFEELHAANLAIVKKAATDEEQNRLSAIQGLLPSKKSDADLQIGNPDGQENTAKAKQIVDSFNDIKTNKTFAAKDWLPIEYSEGDGKEKKESITIKTSRRHPDQSDRSVRGAMHLITTPSPTGLGWKKVTISGGRGIYRLMAAQEAVLVPGLQASIIAAEGKTLSAEEKQWNAILTVKADVLSKLKPGDGKSELTEFCSALDSTQRQLLLSILKLDHLKEITNNLDLAAANNNDPNAQMKKQQFYSDFAQFITNKKNASSPLVKGFKDLDSPIKVATLAVLADTPDFKLTSSRPFSTTLDTFLQKLSFNELHDLFQQIKAGGTSTSRQKEVQHLISLRMAAYCRENPVNQSNLAKVIDGGLSAQQLLMLYTDSANTPLTAAGKRKIFVDAAGGPAELVNKIYSGLQKEEHKKEFIREFAKDFSALNMNERKSLIENLETKGATATNLTPLLEKFTAEELEQLSREEDVVGALQAYVAGRKLTAKGFESLEKKEKIKRVVALVNTPNAKPESLEPFLKKMSFGELCDVLRGIEETPSGESGKFTEHQNAMQDVVVRHIIDYYRDHDTERTLGLKDGLKKAMQGDLTTDPQTPPISAAKRLALYSAPGNMSSDKRKAVIEAAGGLPELAKIYLDLTPEGQKKLISELAKDFSDLKEEHEKIEVIQNLVEQGVTAESLKPLFKKFNAKELVLSLAFYEGNNTARNAYIEASKKELISELAKDFSTFSAPDQAKLINTLAENGATATSLKPLLKKLDDTQLQKVQVAAADQAREAWWGQEEIQPPPSSPAIAVLEEYEREAAKPSFSLPNISVPAWAGTSYDRFPGLVSDDDSTAVVSPPVAAPEEAVASAPKGGLLSSMRDAVLSRLPFGKKSPAAPPKPAQRLERLEEEMVDLGGSHIGPGGPR